MLTKADEKVQAVEALRAADRETFADTEKEIRAQVDKVIADHRYEHERAMRKIALTTDAQAALVERRLRSEYDEIVRVLKASHEGEMRRVGA
jgi:hypothetical protein